MGGEGTDLFISTKARKQQADINDDERPNDQGPVEDNPTGAVWKV